MSYDPFYRLCAPYFWSKIIFTGLRSAIIVISRQTRFLDIPPFLLRYRSCQRMLGGLKILRIFAHHVECADMLIKKEFTNLFGGVCLAR